LSPLKLCTSVRSLCESVLDQLMSSISQSDPPDPTRVGSISMQQPDVMSAENWYSPAASPPLLEVAKSWTSYANSVIRYVARNYPQLMPSQAALPPH
jgi:hypothetical protein